jgi:hypothetical protein
MAQLLDQEESSDENGSHRQPTLRPFVLPRFSFHSMALASISLDDLAENKQSYS